MKIALVAALLLITYAALVVVANRTMTPAAGPLDIRRRDAAPAAGATLTVLDWNLGYAGLGKDANFVADGGTDYRFSDRQLVDKNLDGIIGALIANPADVVVLQEVTQPSVMNHGVPMWDRLTAALPGRDHVFMADVETRFFPPGFGMMHGAGVLSKAGISAAERIPLPLEPGFILGVFRKQYALQVVRIAAQPPQKPWVVINIHLSAFDEGADIRRQQFDATLAFAEAEYEKGHHVVIAGDWNMVLGGGRFPHRTPENYLSWVHALPKEKIPAGWTLAFDPAVPSVRTLHKKYEAGDNFVTVIDGYLVSPNVEVQAIKTLDLEFHHSDHHPVTARFAARP